MHCNIIGAGRLGKNIARAFISAKIISSLSICNRTLESAAKACQEIGSGTAFKQIKQLPPADIVWVCCNDDEIAQVVDLIAKSSCVKPDGFIIHSSGVLTSKILNPLKNEGHEIASLHPLKAFKTNYLDNNAFNQVDCIIEGGDKVCNWLKLSFTRLGAHIIALKPENKVLYHTAACMASNYLITLAACSEELFIKAGLTPQQSRRMLTHLMQGNLSNLQHTQNIAESLTGPLARGDINTISLHLNNLELNHVKNLYTAAGLATLPLTNLSPKQHQAMQTLLEKK